MHLRLLSIAILAIGGFAAASGASALGFGRIPDSIPFGQALDLAVPLRLDAGESLTPACVQAEVQVGDQRLAPEAVTLTLERGGDARDEWRLRLRSAQVVHEPLVAVNLIVGCSGSISRQFVVFADPPDAAAAVTPTAAAAVPPAASLAAAAPAGVLAEAQTGSRALSIAAALSASPPTTAPKSARKNRSEGARPRAQARARPAAATARREAPKRSVVAAVPRLMLEEPGELLRAASLAVAAQDAALTAAAQAASAAQAAASAAEQRLLALQSDLKTMRADAAAHRNAMDQLRTRLAQAEDQGRMQAVLVALLVLLGAVALWLGWKVRSLARERQAAWWQAASQAPKADAAAAAAEMAPPAPLAVAVDEPAPSTSPAPAAGRAPDPESASPGSQPAASPPSTLVEEALIRPVSVDELIDLEQQAEFFVVLGEEDAAIDLLMTHLRRSGGTSPLPYLKLLEIYRRRGEREAYERMRKRFGQRFNAVAPQWHADPERGRDLQDYPAVLATLQACWSEPLDAMAELENLLFRKHSGELFDLPAYRDVLTLFSVARDLHRQDAQPVPDVDVLLPLAAGGELSLSPAPSIFDSLSPGNVEAHESNEDRPTAPVDLDLSEGPALQDSVVGELSPVRATLRQGV